MSTAEPTTFPIDGDSSGFVAAIDKARATLLGMATSARRTRSDLDAVEKSADDTGDAMRKLGANADRAEKKLEKFAETSSTASKFGGVLGGTIGGLAGDLGDLDEVLNSNLTSMQKWALAGTVAAAAVVGIGASVVDTIVNLKDYGAIIDDLSRKKLISSAQIQELRNAEAATVALGGAWRGLRLQMAEAAAPTVERASMGATGAMGGAAFIGSAWSSWLGGGNPLDAGLQAQSAIWEAARSDLEAAGMLTTKAVGGGVAEMTPEQALDALGMLETSTVAVTKATRAHASATRALRSEVEDLSQAELDRAFGLALDAGPVQGASSAQTMGGSDWSARFNAAQDELMEAPERVKVSWQDAFAQVQQSAGAMFAVIGQFADSYVSDDSERAKRAAKRSYAVAKASALAQAALAIPLAVIGQLQTTGPLGIAGAITAGVVGAAQLAAIAASPPPQFHTGGIVSDEELASVRKDEVVLTPRGARAAGLTDSGDVARANAGQAGMGAPAPTYIVVGDEVIGPLRNLATGHRPGLGQRRR